MTQPQGDAGQPGDGHGDGDGFKPITSQDDFNKAIGDRVARERAKFADYDQIKAELDGFRSLADDSKTETDKLREQLEAIQSERNAERLETSRLKVANAHGITDAEDIRLFLTGSDEQTLTDQAKRLAARDADRKKNGNHVPQEGHSASVGGGTDRDFVRKLFGSSD